MNPLSTFLPLALRRTGPRFFLRSFTTPSIPKPEQQEPPQKVVATERTIKNVKHKLFSKATRSFVDSAQCGVRGGVGGDGCASFLRDNTTSEGPANGGNGGLGGDVYVEADVNLTSLQHIGHSSVGGRGQHGGGSLQHGKKGRDVIIKVPPGTVVQEIKLLKVEQDRVRESSQVSYRMHPGSKYQHDEEFEPPKTSKVLKAEKAEARRNLLLGLRGDDEWMKTQRNKGIIQPMMDFEVMEHGERYLLAKGGSGGSGNRKFVTNEDPHPTFATKGVTGQIRRFQFELKTIADAGLVGLPNAGKSTFLTAVSNAHPKIAPYPFTTLNPFIGTVDYADQVQIKIADIPGLVAGAHMNIGLGHSFLKHVERSKILVYIIDLSGPAPWTDLEILRNELEQYLPGLSKKPSIVVANKADQVRMARSNLEEWKRRNPEENLIPVSAKHKKNILKVTDLVRKLVEEFDSRERERLVEEERQFSLSERDRILAAATETASDEPLGPSSWEIVDSSSRQPRLLPSKEDETKKKRIEGR